jgi:polysaccharide export outer membrane protein
MRSRACCPESATIFELRIKGPARRRRLCRQRLAGQEFGMDRTWIVGRKFGLILTAAALFSCGCQTVKTPEEKIARSNIPTELKRTTMPDYIVEPPDILNVEVLEALPGRPITGDFLVKPDGKITLGFYGDVFVAGLTPTDIKEKIILHLRKYIQDEVLGLVMLDNDGKEKLVPPAESSRVYVQVISFNSKVYYVQGDVGAPGRLPITGSETVLDAINYAGGLIPTASTTNIRLVRPAPPGACCESILPVNYAAIVNAGDTTTNYQMMPGDRLVVYRDPIVRTTIFIDRIASPFNSVLNTIFQFSLTGRSLEYLANPTLGTASSTSTTTTGRGATNGVLTPATSNSLTNGAR